MSKAVAPLLLAIMVGLLVLALLSAGQAITFAWLSSFPERASQLQELELKFWSFAAAATVFLGIDLGLLLHLMRRTKSKPKRR